LPCVFQAGARQRAHVCRAFCSRRTAKGVTRRLAPVPSVAFFAVRREKSTAKIVYCALSDVAHDKGALLCKMLPCALCRAPRRKRHGKEVAVRFMAFARQSRGFRLCERSNLRSKCKMNYNLERREANV
jgi:hypothetical protein